MFGAPVKVVKGYIKKLRLDIPWSKLMSKPCEIALEDVHLIVNCAGKFDLELAKKKIWKNKKALFEEIVSQIRVRIKIIYLFVYKTEKEST